MRSPCQSFRPLILVLSSSAPFSRGDTKGAMLGVRCGSVLARVCLPHLLSVATPADCRGEKKDILCKF